MPVRTNIRIQIILSVAKFESPAVVRRKLQIQFGKDISSEGTIAGTFKRFCETGTVGDKERSERQSKITEENIEEVNDVIENQAQSSVRTAHRIMTYHLSLKPYKMHFIQLLYKESFV
jgi:transposase